MNRAIEDVQRAPTPHRRAVVFTLIAASALMAGSALAQGDPPRGLELTPAQRQLIYASISKQTHQPTASPDAFQAQIGRVVPESIQLAALPETIIEVVPQIRGHAYAFIAGQVLIVEPQARRIVEIVAQSAT